MYAIPDGAQLMADDRAFGFGFLPYGELAAMTGKEGAANALAFALEDGAAFSRVEHRLEDALGEFGLERLFSRADQSSHLMLDQEIGQIGGMATSIPAIFILMAVIILYILLKRVIEQERMQIGTLGAFGFSRREILLHYVSYGCVIGLAGGLLGAGGGIAMAKGMTGLYLLYFSLPPMAAARPPAYPAAGVAIGVAAGSLGACMGARSVLRLAPGEAMRPPAPPIVRRDILARLPFLRLVLAGEGQMALRNISRSRFRSFFVVLGVSFSFALLAFMGSYGYMMDAMLIDRFTKVETYDLKLTLEQPRPYTAAVEEAWAIPSVTAAEGLLEVPAELSLGHLKKGIAITALEKDAELFRIHDSARERNLPPPEGGLILSSSLARQLEAKRGDLLTVNSPYGTLADRVLPVTEIVEANLGLAAYGELGTLCELLGAEKLVNAVVLNAGDLPGVKSVLLEAGNLAALTDTGEARKVYDDMLETFASLLLLLQLSGMGVAFAIIANSASISLSERSREYATLRVLGMHPREIGRILRFEFRLLTLWGILLGMPLTYWIKSALSGAISSDLFSLPAHTPGRVFLLAAAACLVTVELCGLLGRRAIARLDMPRVLKERE